MDYDDLLPNGVHDVAVRDGDFENTTVAAGGANFNQQPNWTNLRGAQSLPCSNTTNPSGVGGDRDAYMQGNESVYGQSMGYTIAAGDAFTGSFMYRTGANTDASDHFLVKLFYTTDNTLAGTPTVLFAYETGDYLSNTYKTETYATGVLGTGAAIGKTLMYCFENLGDRNQPGDGKIEFMFSDNHYLAVETLPQLDIPVTSHRTDIGNDPENNYSGAPRFDWPFFGNQTRIITKYPANYPSHRHALGIDYAYYFLESKTFNYPPGTTIANAIQSTPTIPVIQFAQIGKINRSNEDGEKAFAHDPAAITAFAAHYPNLIVGGGQTSEVDGDVSWLFNQYYGRLPVGPGGKVFPSAYLDFTESNLKRSGMPFLLQQHNEGWGVHYVAKERAMSLGGPQLFYRGTANIAMNLATARSAARQYPHPYIVQFSGQPNLLVSNSAEVINHGADPLYTIAESTLGPNYGKSYALNRQALYLSWLNGARSFNWETGEFIKTVASDFPSPLGTFTKKASDIIADFGPTGPVQTPIAILGEFSNAWQPPDIVNNGTINFVIAGDAPYAAGDYQMHGIRDLFYTHYLQCEKIYEATMGEDYALVPTPYGNSIDFLLSDVRKEALQRYGLLVWGGVPPESPSVVREKLLGHITENQGRVVLFGEAARSMFPEWFDDGPATVVAAGATVSYGGLSVSETSDFSLEHLRGGLDAEALSMEVLATVNGHPLIVECLGGLVLVLSDYGINRTALVSPASAHWYDNQLVEEIPHKLLNHTKLLLNKEAIRQTPFSVGNHDLHYVVTRPQDGEYAIGIFNDKLTSEPFNITSAIGPITNLVEVVLDDNKTELKAAAGGAVYAPPGLRDSPDLPLDYGLSDAAHIEGRDFRLFRIQVEESSIKHIPAIQFAARPAGRTLAVAGLENIRQYLQGIPSFFHWFDGVKVDAHTLLSVDDAWIVEQAHWLDRRGARLVVNGAGIDETTALSVIGKLALINSGLKNLIVSAPSASVQSAAASSGVALIAPAEVNRVYRKGERFNPSAALNIVDRYYRNEEDLFRDVRHFESGGVVAELRGELTPADLEQPLAVAQDVSNDFLYVGQGITSLADLLQQDATEFSKFKGVKVDSTYLLSKTTAALAVDAATLSQLGLEVVVDLRRDQMHFDRIAMYPHIPNYASGTNLFNDVIAKMEVIGSSNLILTLQDVGAMRNKAAYIEQRDATWNAFAALAALRNINLHLLFETSLAFSATADFSRSNVFVFQGTKGIRSPYQLVLSTGTIGTGATKIYDDDRGLYANGIFDDASSTPKISFSDWAGSYGVAADTGDSDGDGRNNLLEFAFGGDPTNALPSGYAPVLAMSGNYHYVYPRRKDALLTYWLETATNLLSGSWYPGNYVELPIVGSIDSNFEAVTNIISNSAKQTFVRLNVRNY